MNDHPNVAMEPMAVLIESGNHFVPTQGLALLDDRIFNSRRTVELNVEQAKQFASGSSIAMPSVEGEHLSSWAVAAWNSRPLGWCKVLSNRLNNHLPPWARMNMS